MIGGFPKSQVLAVLVACSLVGACEPAKTNEEDGEPAVENAVNIFAAAEVREHGVIAVQVLLYTDSGATGEGLWMFPPEHPKYSRVVEYLGNPSVGETVTKDYWPEELLPSN